MSKDYFSIPLRRRLEAFQNNGKKSLGGGWRDEQQKWRWVPQGCRDTGGCWGGNAFSISGFVCRWVEDLSGYFRHVKPAHDLIRLGHRGWYVDDLHQSETTCGLVLQLPARDGKSLFMAACSDPWNDNAGIVEQYLYDDQDDAARNADRLAEKYGEDCREDALKSSAELHIEELREEIKNCRTRIRELVAGIRASTLAPAVCDEMRRSIHALRNRCQAKTERIEKITREPWVLIPH